MKYFSLMFGLFFILSCSKVPTNDVPIVSSQGTSVTFNVNMSYQIEIGSFNPEINFLDVAGSFNDWCEPCNDHILVSTDNSIYSITLDNLASGEQIQFKFRVDGDWSKGEFPGLDNNRSHTIIDGNNTLDYWFNDEGGK